MIENKNVWLAPIALTLASFIWASSFIALKYAFQTFSPMLVIFGRLFVASVCFLLLWKYTFDVKVKKSDIKYLILMAFFEPCLYFIFEAQAIKNTTASNAGMITALLPLMVAVSARIFLKEAITRNMIIGFILAIIGAIWLSFTTGTNEYSPHPMFGNFMEFLAMVCAAGYILMLKHLSKNLNSFFLTAVQAFVGTLFYLPILFFPSMSLPNEFKLMPFLSIIYLGAVVTLGAYGLYNFGVSRTKASTASAYINLIPAFTVILAYFLLGEKLSFEGLIASFVIFAGVIISQIQQKKKYILSNS